MKHKWKLDEHGKPDEWSWDSGFCNGVYCERFGKTVCIHCNPLWEELDDCMEPPKPKPKTNAKRICATDDELATMLHAVKMGYAPWCDYHCENECDDGCDNCIKKWLQQPAEEG